MKPALVVRPGTPADLDTLIDLAANAVPRLTNLPAHRERLAERLARSVDAFARTIETPGDEMYVFVLEDQAGEAPQIVGTASIRARTGAREAYYTWRREMLIHASQQLDVRREVPILSLSHELSEASLLCAFSLDARYRGTVGERLLRRARLLFVAQHPERFMPRIAVAMPGHLDDQQQSPFWESVGRHFFVRDFAEINEMAGIYSKSFIAEVIPPFPLYQALLSDSARAAIGSIHAAHFVAAADLRAEGLEDSRHIDLFDGGLLLSTTYDRLYSVRHNQWHPVRLRDDIDPNAHGTALMANQGAAGFRCIAAPHARSNTGQLLLAPEHAEQLGLETGRAVLAVALPAIDHETTPC
ncbi:MAG: arginine N-succinyltransferase [Salinisphaera sp.]|nr:arginine N-succinyltransferase [Salinisphaera sp.]